MGVWAGGWLVVVRGGVWINTYTVGVQRCSLRCSGYRGWAWLIVTYVQLITEREINIFVRFRPES